MAGLLILAIIYALVVGHEIAHYLVARAFGFQAPVFGFGLPYGPYAVLGKKWDTEFRVHWLIFGAYASIPELDPELTADDGTPLESLPKPFTRFALWKKLTVAFAGIFFYLVAAWLIMFASLNIFGAPESKVIVQGLSTANPIAGDAGIKPGDEVVAVDDKKVSRPDEVVSYLIAHPDTSVTVHVKRAGNMQDVSMRTNSDGKVGMMLVNGSGSTYRRVNPIESISLANEGFIGIGGAALGATKGYIAERFHADAGSGANSEKRPSRPYGMLAVMKFASDIIAMDSRYLLSFAAFLSFDLAVVNLVPWPGLDGSHIVMILINAARGKTARGNRIWRLLFVIGLVFCLLRSTIPLCMLHGHNRQKK